jgi:hypothetical protein
MAWTMQRAFPAFYRLSELELGLGLPVRGIVPVSAAEGGSLPAASEQRLRKVATRGMAACQWLGGAIVAALVVAAVADGSFGALVLNDPYRALAVGGDWLVRLAGA